MASRYSAIVTGSLLIVVSTLSCSITAVHAQELKPHPLLRVVDANGRRVGLVIGMEATQNGAPSDVWIAFKVDGMFSRFKSIKIGFWGRSVVLRRQRLVNQAWPLRPPTARDNPLSLERGMMKPCYSP
jgi:hypothetical protein